MLCTHRFWLSIFAPPISTYCMILRPVRKIGLSHRSITGKYFSRKTGTMHVFESALERDWLTLLEFDNEVLSYTTQPVKIFYEHDGKAATYTPDVIAYYQEELRRKPMLCEVKYQAELLEKQSYYEPKFAAATQYAHNNGWSFATINEQQVRTVYLENLKLLSRYQQTNINKEVAETVLQKLAYALPITQVTGGDPKLLYAVWQLLAAQRIKCDMQTKITMNTIIWKS